jgi:uncharacterized protein YdaU (DUF1376 family)
MMHYWRKGELPDDDSQLAKITKLPLRTWCDYRPVLQGFFHSGWRHKRIDAELARMLRVSEKRASAGQKGGIGSGLSRLRLENAARGRSLPQAIASFCSSKTQANVDHSHSHSQKNLSSKADETAPAKSATAPAAAKDGKAIPVSAELAALIARKTS